MLKFLHHYWAYLLLIMLITIIIKAVYSLFSGNKFNFSTDFRLATFTWIVFEIQILLGLTVYFTSDYFQGIKEGHFGEYMKSAPDRLIVMEHPVMMIIAFLILYYGYNRLKKVQDSRREWIDIIIFYGLAFLLVLLRIPWAKL